MGRVSIVYSLVELWCLTGTDPYKTVLVLAFCYYFHICSARAALFLLLGFLIPMTSLWCDELVMRVPLDHTGKLGNFYTDLSFPER